MVATTPHAPPSACAGTVRAYAALAEVADPEIPVLSILELGIVREVRKTAAGVEVTITPTYTGCPAMEVIEQDIKGSLAAAGFAQVSIRRSLSPAWTTDRISEAGREKLRAYGIAPPGTARTGAPLRFVAPCPGCGSPDTELLSEFGSTACKALYRCCACREPFDYFKPL